MGSELDRVMQKYGIANQGMAQTLGAMGRGNDSLVAHITPREAMLLKAMGGSGTINPRTGLLEFDDGGGDGNGGDGGGGDAGAEGGGSSEDGDGGVSGEEGTGPSVSISDVDAAIAAGYGPESPNYGYSIDTTALSDAIAAGLGPESPGWSTPEGFDPSNPSDAIALGYGPESPGWGSPASYGGDGGGGGYDSGNGGSGGGNYYDPVSGGQAPVATAPGGTLPPSATTPGTTTPGATAPVATAPVATAPTGNFQFVPYSAPASYGFELNRLMQQYGVSTPTMMPFAGYTTQTTPDDARRAEYDRTAYQNYVNQFNNRLAQTNMYNRAQFVPEPAKFTPQYSAPIANPAYAPTNYGGIYNTYTKYFGRTPEEAGVQYWGKTGATGDALQNAILSGAQNADLEYLRSQYPDMNYARGGAVKTRYAEGGEAEGPETERSNRGSLTPEAAATPNAAATPTPAPTPAQPAPITATGSTRLAELLNQYARPSTDYARELGEARRRSQSETEAFSNMIQQMSQRGESPTSRAEMYFRLASAFGSPTRTGMFTENLALVGKEMGEFAKGRRAEEAERRGLSLKAQELRMTGAREDLATTRALAGQEAAERRAINSKIVEAYVRSGEPQSAAGKAAVDEGLRPGTPEYQARVQQLTDLNVSRMQELINAQQDNIRLRNESSQQLSTPEMNVLNDAMQNVSTARDNLASLRQALALNPNTAPSNLTQGTLNEVRRRLGSTSPTVVNTDELVNILSRLSLNSLKETFPGAISNDERRALQEVQGINAQNLESRRRILERAIASLETMIPRTEARIAEIRSGAFGRRTPQEVATPPGGASAPGAVTSSSPGAVTSASPGAVAPAGGR